MSPRTPKKKSSAKKSVDFPYAIRSFLGYLEGTEKALHTVKNYRLDLLAFQDFLQNRLGPNPKALDQVVAEDLDRYHDFMRSQGLKTNTRRRKLMTLRRFLSYLAGRKKLPNDLGRTLPTPYKLERIPVALPADELMTAIRKLPDQTPFDLRNRVLLRTLLETGCLISELCKLRWSDWNLNGETARSQPWVEFAGKSPRRVQITTELLAWAAELKTHQRGENPWVFLGFNKFGALGRPISPRGIEVLVKSCAPKLGFPDLVPRTLRHSAVIDWLKQGRSEREIQDRLGLKSDYAFRGYLKSSYQTT